jgi:hypothetical protein
MVMNSCLPPTKSRASVGLAALARPRNHDDRRVLERGSHQFGGKAGKERVIGIVHAGWQLRLVRIDSSSISDYGLV